MQEQNLENNANAAGVNGQPTPAPKKKKGTKIITFAIILVIAAIAVTGYKYYNQTTETADEWTAYEMLESNETLADYEDYLNRFPDGEHAIEVRDRYEALQKMYAEWRSIVLSGHQRDFELFKKNYPESVLYHQCELKIDSLDWVDAVADGSSNAVRSYLDAHPDGRYASEADIMLGKIAQSTATPEETLYISSTIDGFFTAFGKNDVESVFSYITPTMSTFLTKADATKADVADIIGRTYNEHILSCRFVVNDDYVVKKSVKDDGTASYSVEFSVDQHIERDNEGKTFGSYTATAELTAQFKLSSLKLKEISRR